MAAQPGEESEFYLALLDDDPEELYENAPCAYLSTTPDGVIVKVNGTFLAWTGFSREQLVGRRRFQQLLAPGDRIFYETHFAPALRMQGQLREIAVEVVCGNGSRLPVLVNSVQQSDEHGEPRVVRTALFDARERRSYERELLAERKRAEESEARATALARTLQSTFLPPELVAVPGLDIAGVYRPSGDGNDVGGDFYDVFDTGSGDWGVVLGDVCGKGAAAASLTAVARYTARAEATRAQAPSEVLQGVHRSMLAHDPDQFCTAVYLSIEARTDGSPAVVTIASGGHHLPLHVDANGKVVEVGTVGSILGMLDTADVSDADIALEADETLVLYTDGVVEARDASGAFFGEERLAALLATAPASSAAEVARRVVDDAVAFQGGTTRDDIAVIVIKA